MNSGRSAVRAGYKASSAVWQGYQLRQKPRIAQEINIRLERTKEQLNDLILRIAFLCRDRMFFDITHFYRSCKRTVKRRGVIQEIKSMEAIPLDEISKIDSMCIDAIDIKTIGGKDEIWYKLPDRNKAFKLFMKCYDIIMPIKNTKEMDWKAAAELIRACPERLLSPKQNTAMPRKTRQRAFSRVLEGISVM